LQTFVLGPYTKGSHTYIWNGKDIDDITRAEDVYVFAIEANEINGARQFLYKPVYVPGSVQIQNTSAGLLNFNPYKSEMSNISYNLSMPAWVTLKVGILNATTPTRTLFINKPKDIINADVWDGRGDNGVIVSAGAYVIFGWANLLPSNSVVIRKNLLPLINFIKADPYAFYPAYGDQTHINYSISKNARITVSIKNSAGSTVRTLVNDVPQNVGDHNVAWDGKNDSGQSITASGNYTINITAVDQAGVTEIKKSNISLFR